jgi:hypothetical protein
MTSLIQPNSNPLAVTTDELTAAFREIVRVLANGEEIGRESLNLFLTAPRLDVDLADYARVLAMLEKSSDWSSDALYVIRVQNEIIRRLVSAQTLSILDRSGPQMGMVGEVQETTRTVRFAAVPASGLPSVLTDTSVRFAAPQDRTPPISVRGVPLEHENVDEPPETDSQTDGKRTAAQRKDYVKDARARADRHLRRWKKDIALSARQLAKKLGISKSVAADALANAREFQTDTDQTDSSGA